jgi:signal transduction histidine kinase/DNA-binding response OmpR family regulator
LRRLFNTADRWGPVLVAAVLLAAAWLACAAQISALKERVSADAVSHVKELSGSYENDVASTIVLVDNMLRFIAAYDAENGPLRTATLIEREHLYRGLSGNVAVVDTRGHGFAIGVEGRAPISVGDRAHVQASFHTSGLIIGRPLIGRVTKRFSIPFARGVRRPDGTLVGSVNAVIDVNAFRFGYDTNDFGPKGVAEIVGRYDRIVRARLSAAESHVSPIGRRLSGGTQFARADAKQSDIYWVRSSSDNTLRVFAYHLIPGYPLVALAGLAYDDLLARTAGIQRVMVATAAAASLIILIVLAAWMQQRKVRRQLHQLQILEAAAKEEAMEATEVALRATAAKSEFLANMSHEIRTPMNGVMGLTHLALLTELTPKQRDYLNKIDYSAKALLNIINDILDFSKIEAGKLDLENISFDLASVLDNIRSVAEMRSAEKGLTFAIHVAAGVPAELIGDPVRYGQILLNLVTNALKFTDTGEVIVNIAVARESARDIELITTVRDTGIGMSEDDRSRLFQSFSQADSSITRRFGGTGLGLAISKALAEKMGGGIGVESSPGAGSTFTFNVTFIRPERRAQVRSSPAVFGRRVIVVDDDPIARESLSATLASWKMNVITATSGTAALAAIRQASVTGEPIELVLMDWKMPGQNGVEVAEAIRTAMAGTKPPIIVMVSAFGRADVFASAKRAGIEGFLVKPVDPSLLLETIQSLFSTTVATRETAPVSVVAEHLKGTNVLVAEDNDINRQIIDHLLQRLGITVTFATNGREAVDAVFAPGAHFDAVLMDVQMPVMDGLEATRLIRAHIDATKLPIIAMTAHAMEQERQMCLDAGMNDHLTKPVDPKSVTLTLGQWITPGRSVPSL